MVIYKGKVDLVRGWYILFGFVWEEKKMWDEKMVLVVWLGRGEERKKLYIFIRYILLWLRENEE